MFEYIFKRVCIVYKGYLAAPNIKISIRDLIESPVGSAK